MKRPLSIAALLTLCLAMPATAQQPSEQEARAAMRRWGLTAQRDRANGATMPRMRT